jgi:hypothetical protein
MGAGASAIPMHIDKETFRKLSGGTLNDAIFDANSNQGIMTRDRLMELANMRDCFLSHELTDNDCYGRNIHERVARINQSLKAKGLITWFDESLPAPTEVVGHITTGINRSRAVVCFFTQSYFEKVLGAYPTDPCHLAFLYTLSKKHPNYIVPVAFEEATLNPQTWPGNIGLALSTFQPINFIDDNNWEAKIDELYHRIVKISKAGENLSTTESLKHTSILSVVNKSKEEQQFFQWLARSTRIEESKRMIYCVSLVKSGVQNVFTLAKTMNAQPNFLLSIGINENDADQIALAIRDLGLGYVPVRDFDKALTIESVVYALRKASTSSEDPTLAENALNCAARVAASNKIMPQVMNDAGISEAILKLMQRNLSHAPSMEAGCLAIVNMSEGNPVIAENLGVLTGCDVLPRTVKCHIDNLRVVYNGAWAIACLATTKDNRHRFSNTGGCDMIVKSIQKSINDPEVLERCYLAGNRLCFGNPENIGRLGVAGINESTIQVVALHYSHSALMRQVFELLTFLAIEPSHRLILGAQEAATSAICQALSSQIDYSEAIVHGCNAVAANIQGNAHNRSMFCKGNAPETIKAVILKYSNDVNVIQAACKAVFALAAGNLEQKVKFQGIQGILQNVLNRRDLPDKVRSDVKEALLKIQ